jgi:hypothetical protein
LHCLKTSTLPCCILLQAWSYASTPSYVFMV